MSPGGSTGMEPLSGTELANRAVARIASELAAAALQAPIGVFERNAGVHDRIGQPRRLFRRRRGPERRKRRVGRGGLRGDLRAEDCRAGGEDEKAEPDPSWHASGIT